MTFAAILLTLISSLGWTFYDLFRKRLSTEFEPISLAALLMLGQAPFFLLWAYIEGVWFIQMGYLVPGGLSIFFNLIAHVLFVKSVRLAPISETIPLLSLTPALSTVGSFFLLNEKIALISWVGIILIIIGTLIITGVRFEFSDDKTRGLAYMAVVAALWSITPALDKMAFSFSPPPIHALLQVGVIYLILQIGGYGLNRGSRPQLQKNKMIYGAAVAIAAIAVATQFKALAVIPVGIFEASKRGIAMALTLFFGYLMFSEPITRKKVIAVLLIICGVLLVFSPEFVSF